MSYLVDVKKITKSALKGVKDSVGDWTYDTKLTVAQVYENCGNLRITGEVTEVPVDTIRLWMKSENWPAVVHEMRRAKRAELSSRLSGIVNSALEKIEDRLEHGDFVLNQKTGEIIRKPISLRDANQVAKDLLGQQIEIQKIDGQSAEVHTSVQDVLKHLASEFTKLNKKLKQNNATDIAFVETVDESNIRVAPSPN